MMSIQDVTVSEDDNKLEKWQDCFSKLFSNLLKRVRKILNYKVQVKFFANLMPIQQKGRRVPITLQKQIDGKIDKLIDFGKHFVSI